MCKQFDYEHVEVGQELGQLDYHVDEELNRRFSAAVGNPEPWYLLDAQGTRIAEPTIFGRQYLRMLRNTYPEFRMHGVHASSKVAFIRPVYFGYYHIFATITDKYVKRGGKYIVIETTVKDEKGSEVVLYEDTLMTNYPEFRELRGR